MNGILQNKKIATLTLGCKVNQYETDGMRELLEAEGCQMVEFTEQADAYIVNTCSVTNIAEKKSRQMLHRAKKLNPEAVVVAVGCYVQTVPEEVLKDCAVDLVIGNNYKKDIVGVLTEYFSEFEEKTKEVSYKENDIIVNKNTDDNTIGDITRDNSKTRDNSENRDGGKTRDNNKNRDNRKTEDNNKSANEYTFWRPTDDLHDYEELKISKLQTHTRAYVKIQDGCNQFCTYCIIPYVRGRIRSRKPEDIITEIRGLAENGCKEVVLTGIHISSYGKDWNEVTYHSSDLNGQALLELIRMINDIEGICRIRLGSLEPRIMTEEFVAELARIPKLCPHFHLSLQSACDDTLKRMNRKYTIEEYIECCERLRKVYDRPAITTDVIVGFPGETEEEFKTTFHNLERLKLYEIHVFKYSPRRGTIAEKLPDQVREEDKNQRSDILLSLTAKQKREYEESFVGEEVEVLVEEKADICDKEELTPLDKKKTEDIYIGHTERYVKVKLQHEADCVNQLVRIVIRDDKCYSLG